MAGYPLDNALFNWEAGARYLDRIESAGGAGAALRVVSLIRDEIRRRLGVTFAAAHQADVDRGGNHRVRAIDGVDPSAPDLQELTDAAFHEQLKAATDFAGGRVVEGEAESAGGPAIRPGES